MIDLIPPLDSPPAALAVVAALASLAAVALAARTYRTRRELAVVRAELDDARRTLERHGRQDEVLARFFHDFPEFSRRLHAHQSRREVSAALLELLQRVFEPQEAVVALSLEGQGGAAERPLTVTSVLHGGKQLRVGLQIQLGIGELGAVAVAGTAMERADFDRLGSRLRHERIAGFEVDAAVPMMIGDELLGVLALSRPTGRPERVKEVLRMVAGLGALGCYNARAYARLKREAETDKLTAVLNKASIVKTLSQEVLSAERQQQPLAILLLDIDHFKNYNDTNGHLAGDRLLAELTKLVSSLIRNEDAFGRFGGEEFLLVLPNTSPAGAFNAAEKIRTRIVGSPFPQATSQPLGMISVSIGLACYPEHAGSSTRLLQSADEALYRAKAQGRNRVDIAVPIGMGG